MEALHRNLFLSLAIAGAAIILLLAAPGMSSPASANACHRFGDRSPSQLHTPQARKAVICLLNQRRRGHHLGRLDMNKRLRNAAQNHSDYMRNHGCFSHQCSGERSPFSRLQSVGYLVSGLTRWAYGENIAWGLKSAGTPRDIVNAWMHSPEHRVNMLSRTFKDVGVGFAKGTPYSKVAKGGLYTMDFGLRQG